MWCHVLISHQYADKIRFIADTRPNFAKGQPIKHKLKVKLKLKGAIKSHHMFILSYVTFYSRFCDANLLPHRAVSFSKFTFSFYLPGQPHVQNHVSGKEN